MPRVPVECVEIGISRALLHDKDGLAKEQQLVETIRGQSLKALPFHMDRWHCGHTRSLNVERRRRAMEPSDYGPFPYTPVKDRPTREWQCGARQSASVVPNH